MKLHRNLVFATIDSLHLIFNEHKQADKVLKNTLKRDKRWGARDRGFIAETTYDIVRWKRLYSKIADVKEPYNRANLFRLFTVWATLKGIQIPDWPQFETTPTRKIKGKFDELSKIRKYKESVPDWLDDLGLKELGKKWDKEIHSLNQLADVILRVNTLKTTKEKLQNNLQELDIETESIKGYPQALKLVKRTNVFVTEAFKNGWFEVQDASSQKVAKFLNPKPGTRVVDTCAGAGGKSLHIASLMENKGQVIALDIYENKLKELKRRAKRNGVHNIETRTIGDDILKFLKKYTYPGKWEYLNDEITNKDDKFFLSELLRETLLTYLHKEIPYNISIRTTNFKELSKSDIKIKQKILINEKRYKKIILGKKGSMIKKIREECQKKIKSVFKKKIHLYIELIT